MVVTVSEAEEAREAPVRPDFQVVPFFVMAQLDTWLAFQETVVEEPGGTRVGETEIVAEGWSTVTEV